MKKVYKTEEERIKGERARKIHASFFDKTEEAINSGYYLEALCMEYSAIEARLSVIMRELGLICGAKKLLPDQTNIDISRKLKCLKTFLDDDVFKDTYFEGKKEIDTIFRWIKGRNERIHALYSDTEKYEAMVSKNRALAKEGLKHARTMYDEANRLKNIKKRHPEVIKAFKGKCQKTNDRCKKLEEELKQLSANK